MNTGVSAKKVDTIQLMASILRNDSHIPKSCSREKVAVRVLVLVKRALTNKLNMDDRNDENDSIIKIYF